SQREDIDELVAVADREFGPIEIACSNAGIAAGTGLYAAPEAWADSWAVNVMGHVHLAQAVLPGMALRREGYLLITASAAGLLGLPGDAPYSVTKHAAVGLAEWLAFTYQRRGIRVSALCPYGVRTDFLMPGVTAGHPAATAVAAAAPILEPADVAETVVGGLAAERFLILPHADVAGMHAGRAADPDAWIASQASGGRAAAAAER
ncbi:MAG: SDR family oxidoreductase, partial [Steroidobacteraceae bacterium]